LRYLSGIGADGCTRDHDYVALQKAATSVASISQTMRIVPREVCGFPQCGQARALELIEPLHSWQLTKAIAISASV
jgi:hypothetical protein